MVSRPGSSGEILIEDGLSRKGKSSANKLNGRSSSDINVEFRHTDSSVRGPKINGINSTLQQRGTMVNRTKQDQFSLTIDRKTGQDDRGNDILKKVTIYEHDDGRSKKDSSLPDEEGMKQRPQPERRLEHSLSINKKSAMFIEQKKNAMRRNYSFDPDK